MQRAPEIGGERGGGGITREEVIAELSVSAVREERFGTVGIHVYGIVHAVLHGCRQTDFAVVESPPVHIVGINACGYGKALAQRYGISEGRLLGKTDAVWRFKLGKNAMIQVSVEHQKY